MAKLTSVTSISVVRSTSHHQWWSWLELPSSWLQWWSHLHFRDDSQPGTFSSEDGFNHLQRWGWLHLQWWSQLKSPEFPWWKSTRHLQQWKWLQSPSEARLTSPFSVGGKVNSVIFSAQLYQLHSWRLMLSTSFSASSILIILLHNLLCSTVTYKLVHFRK